MANGVALTAPLGGNRGCSADDSGRPSAGDSERPRLHGGAAAEGSAPARGHRSGEAHGEGRAVPWTNAMRNTGRGTGGRRVSLVHSHFSSPASLARGQKRFQSMRAVGRFHAAAGRAHLDGEAAWATFQARMYARFGMGAVNDRIACKECKAL